MMKRLKKILKWSGIVLGGLVAILLVLNAWFVWTTDARLESQLAAIRQAGDPLTLADLARKPIPPEQNAATYLRRAEPDIAAMEKELQPYYEWWPKNSEGSLLPPDIQKVVQAAFGAHPKVVPLLEQAAACPDYDEQLDYSVSADSFWDNQFSRTVQRCRGAARMLDTRARLLTSQGNREEAVRAALAISCLGRHFEHNPMMISYLVAVAVRGVAVSSANMALQAGSVSPDLRRVLDAELAMQERTDQEGYVWAIKSERAYMLETIPKTIPGRSLWFCRAFWNRHESTCLDVWQAEIPVATDGRSYRQAESAFDKIERNSSGFAKLLFPGMKAFCCAHASGQACVRTLRVLNAIQAHVPVGSHEAPKLSELGLPVEATTDPFNGESLHVKRLPQGWLVYSVGRNFRDDGGKLDDNSDVGVGPPIPAGKPVGK
jgi:hypothetical protein